MFDWIAGLVCRLLWWVLDSLWFWQGFDLWLCDLGL